MKSIAALTLLALSGAARAAPPHDADPVAAHLFPPDLIMGHQQELGVDDKQRQAISAEMQKAQAELMPLQWQMQAATEQLVKLLEAPRVDEAKALAQADQMMSIERQFKRIHLGMLIRVRNVLTEAQRARLAELRKESP